MKSVTSGGTSSAAGLGRGVIALNRTTRPSISSGLTSTVLILHPSPPARRHRRRGHSRPAARGLHERLRRGPPPRVHDGANGQRRGGTMLSMQQISDRLEIQEIVTGYGYAVDNQDW